MNTAQLLNEDDRCGRLPYLSQRWQTPAVTPTEALYEAVECGLTSKLDPAEVAHEALMQLAVERGFDSNQTDLLQEAEHLAGLAAFIVYLLRPGDPWKRPDAINLPDGTPWQPSAFLSASEGHLRRLVLCGRWDAYRQTEAEYDWRTLEGAIYGVPMDLVVVVLGQERNGRRHGPIVKGWTHPVSKQLRFRKRDGTGFDGAWEPVFREQSDFTREEWLDALVEDGLLPECVLVHQVENIGRGIDVHGLAQAKLSRIQTTRTPPDPQLSRCFDRFHPCPFRSCCPRGLEPSEDLGFVPRSHHPANFTAQIIG